MPGERFSARVRIEREGAPPRLDVSLAVEDGITAVMGPSGAGKTTLFTAIAGLLRPDAGRIVLDGDVLFDAVQGVFVPAHRRRIGLVFQSLALFPHLSVCENVAYGAPKVAAPRREHALRWLERAHVAHLAERAPSTLSGGEAQRVALARALAAEPRMMLLDEPFSSLDVKLRCALGEELLALVQEVKVPALIVTHDPEEARRVASRTIFLEAGRLA